jgi:hypothetical protein
MKKFITTIGAATLLLTTPVTSLASSVLWDNPTEYYSMPNGTTESNKSERLDKGHTYQISFDAETYGENVLLLYTQNKSYLNEFIPLTQEWQHFEYTITPKANTHVVFEDLQSLGDINIRNISIVKVK